MIVYYDTNTITKLNTNRFTYSTYDAIGVNKLKYQNDSSVSVRLLQAASNMLKQTLKNDKYSIRFDYNKVGANNIDAIHAFKIAELYKNLDETKPLELGTIYGFSKYTGQTYVLKGIADSNEFTRFSYPCDITIAGSATNNTTVQELILKQNVVTKINTLINNTRVTISPVQGFNMKNIESIDYPITITIEGYDIASRLVREDIVIEEFIDYTSYNQYSFIRSVKSKSNANSITIDLYPYIRGKVEVWDDEIVDREYGDSYKTIVNIDIDNKNLLFSKKLSDIVDYPDTFDIYNVVKLNALDENIQDFFIDTDNEYVYILTESQKLYCYPLLIPIKFNREIDYIKTTNQSAKIQYANDELAEKYNFVVIPSSKSNGVEFMNIFINDSIYKSDILLDLYREGLEDNRIEIPYSDIFVDSDTATIRFETTGDEQSTMAVFLYKKVLDPIYIKDLNTISKYSNDTTYLKPYLVSTFPKYYNPNLTGFNTSSKIYRLSNIKDIFIDGYRLAPVYDTYYVDSLNGYIITSDTITQINK